MSDKIKNILQIYAKGLLEILGDDLNKVILYGSYARGEQDGNGEISDIDIMILVNTSSDKKIKEIEHKVIDYSYELDLKYDILISPIIENIEVYKSRVNYINFYKNIKNEGVLING